MVAKSSQTSRFVASLMPQDITTLRTGAFVDISGAQRVAAVPTVAGIANTKTVTIALLQAQDTAGTGAKALGSAVVATATANNQQLTPLVDAQVTDLDTANGFKCVAVTLLSNNAAAVYGGAILILGGNRFNP